MVIYWNLLTNSIDMWNSTRIPQWIEKWFDTYEKHRYRYDSIDEFIDWYNEIKPHFSLGLRTPEEVFWKKCLSYILGNLLDINKKGDKI